MTPEERQQTLAGAIFALAKANAEYAALPLVQQQWGGVNPYFTGELLQTMQDNAALIARLLINEEQP